MKLNELLGIEFPFIQGGMANIATAEFVAAVSNAGALGLIGAGGMSPEVFRDSIRRCRQLTDKPFGVNLLLKFGHLKTFAAPARVIVHNQRALLAGIAHRHSGIGVVRLIAY